MALITRIGRCENCRRTMKLRTLRLCPSCWKHRDEPNYQPGAPRSRPIPKPSVADKLWDEWWHFKALCGRERAIILLAAAFEECDQSFIRRWADKHDPEPRTPTYCGFAGVAA